MTVTILERKMKILRKFHKISKSREMMNKRMKRFLMKILAAQIKKRHMKSLIQESLILKLIKFYGRERK